MTHKKIWTLYKPDATHVDATYIMGLGCEVEVVMPEWQEFTFSGGFRGQFSSRDPYIKITTTCEKQETMLYLKYEDDLRLKTIIHRKFEPEYADINMASHSR